MTSADEWDRENPNPMFETEQQMSASPTAETRSPDVRRLESGLNWSGFLTLDNIDAVAGRIRAALAGKRFTFVASNEGLRNYFPEVRTGLEMREVTVSRDGDGRWASFNVSDSYGVWGAQALPPDQQAARDAGSDSKTCVYMRITRGRYDEGRIEIEHYAPIGSRLCWVIAVEAGQGEAGA